jgi:REP element-mobilizing transposase RayT
MAIVRDGFDTLRFVGTAERVIRSRHWVCLAWCLMTTHYHLLVATPEPDLAAGMHVINGSYARWFNERHDRKGHLFRARYWDARVETDEHFRRAVRYIARNPLEARMCTALEQWPWNGYCEATQSSLCRLLDRPALLAHFGDDEGRGLARYRALVLDDADLV